MSKKIGAGSYEGFRRKNSLSSIEVFKESTSSDLSLLKFKKEEQISEIEQLSLDLDTFRRKSLTSRSFCEGTSGMSNRSLNESKDGKDTTANHWATKAEGRSKTVFSEVQAQQTSQQETRPGLKYFNTINEVIEEDYYLNEEELIETIEPVTFKNASTLPSERKGGERPKTTLGKGETAATAIQKR